MAERKRWLVTVPAMTFEVEATTLEFTERLARQQVEVAVVERTTGMVVVEAEGEVKP